MSSYFPCRMRKTSVKSENRKILDKYPPLADNCEMVFIETATFSRSLLSLLDDDSYAVMQQMLIEQPEKGDLIQGGGGIRKLRHALPGRGKSGGVRVIYYWHVASDQIYLLLIYPKSKKADLSAQETAFLRDLVKQLAKEIENG